MHRRFGSAWCRRCIAPAVGSEPRPGSRRRLRPPGAPGQRRGGVGAGLPPRSSPVAGASNGSGAVAWLSRRGGVAARLPESGMQAAPPGRRFHPAGGHGWLPAGRGVPVPMLVAWEFGWVPVRVVAPGLACLVWPRARPPGRARRTRLGAGLVRAVPTPGRGIAEGAVPSGRRSRRAPPAGNNRVSGGMLPLRRAPPGCPATGRCRFRVGSEQSVSGEDVLGSP